MTPILALLIIALLAMLIIRIGTLALTMTGLGRDAASFQSVSAFFGVGFTTRESELVMGHPIRRRIIRDLIICGNIGLTGVVATVAATAVGFDAGAINWHRKAIVLAVGLAVMLAVPRLRFVRAAVDWSIERSLKSAGVVRALDYDTLLKIGSGFSVSEVEVSPTSPIAGRTLGELRLRSLGVVVLGISRSGANYIGVPNGDSRLIARDVLTVYGKDSAIRDLAEGRLPVL